MLDLAAIDSILLSMGRVTSKHPCKAVQMLKFMIRMKPLCAREMNTEDIEKTIELNEENR